MITASSFAQHESLDGTAGLPADHTTGHILDADSGELARGLRLGPYTLQERIHRRGDSTVYTAWTRTSERVALKVLDRRAARSIPRLRAFYVAAKLSMLLNHPRLIPVWEVGEFGGWHFQVQPLIEQPTLQQHLWGERPLTEPAAWRLVLGLAEGLELLHRAGFVHRDVSTENIFLHESMGWVLGGFGRLLDRTAKEDLTGFSLQPHWHPFQAPEVLLGQGQAALPACDVYGLAAVLAKCLLGSIPFECRTREECLALKRQQSSLWLSEGATTMSRETARFLTQCLDPDPARRPASLVEFLKQGARCLEQSVEALWPRLSRLTPGATEGTWHAWRSFKSGRQLHPIPPGHAEYYILRGQWGPQTQVSCNPQGPFLPLGKIPEFRRLLELADN